MNASTRALPVCEACHVACGVAFLADYTLCLGCGARVLTLEPAGPRPEGGRKLPHEYYEMSYRRARRVR